jgi:hypothetical protein
LNRLNGYGIFAFIGKERIRCCIFLFLVGLLVESLGFDNIDQLFSDLVL